MPCKMRMSIRTRAGTAGLPLTRFTKRVEGIQNLCLAGHPYNGESESPNAFENHDRNIACATNYRLDAAVRFVFEILKSSMCSVSEIFKSLPWAVFQGSRVKLISLCFKPCVSGTVTACLIKTYIGKWSTAHRRILYLAGLWLEDIHYGLLWEA